MEGDVQNTEIAQNNSANFATSENRNKKKKIRQIPEYLNTESELDVMPKLHLFILRLVQITQK